jgi:hypothetical protein
VDLNYRKAVEEIPQRGHETETTSAFGNPLPDSFSRDSYLPSLFGLLTEGDIFDYVG